MIMKELVDKCYKEGLFKIPKGVKNSFAWMRALNVIGFFTLSLLALYGGFPAWIAILMVIGQAVIGTSCFGFIAHEATHRDFPKNNFCRVGSLRDFVPSGGP